MNEENSYNKYIFINNNCTKYKWIFLEEKFSNTTTHISPNKNNKLEGKIKDDIEKNGSYDNLKKRNYANSNALQKTRYTYFFIYKLLFYYYT